MTLSAVENPGWKISEKISDSVKFALAFTKPRSMALCKNASAVEAFAIVLDADDDAAALVGSGEANSAELRLTLRDAVRRILKPVIDRVADHMNKGITQLFDNVAIELGLLTFQQELNLLLLLRGEISHQSVHLVEHRADRDHAKRHGVALKFRGDPAELAQAAHQLKAVDHLDVGVLDHHRLGDDQLAHEIDQVVQLGGIELYEPA